MSIGRLEWSHTQTAPIVRIMIKANGSVLIHADAGGYKPLNWTY